MHATHTPESKANKEGNWLLSRCVGPHLEGHKLEFQSIGRDRRPF